MSYMPKKIDLTGQKFNNLTVISAAQSRGGKTYWLCQCDCGNRKEIQGTHLKSGAIKSCGCKKQKMKNILTKEPKYCEICKKEFYPNIIGMTRKYCYECSPADVNRSEQITSLRHAMKKEMVKQRGGKCERCGYNKCIDALHFHHIKEKEKEFGLSENGIIHSWILYQEEASKCELLCANCHAEEHYNRNHKNKI